VTALLEGFNDEVFVFGKDLGEAIRFFDCIDDLGAGLLLGVAKGIGIDDVGPQAELLAGLASDGGLIARDHLDV